MHQLTSSTLKRPSVTISSDNKIINHSAATYLEKLNIKHKEPWYVEEDFKSVLPSSSPMLITSSPVTTLLPNSHALSLLSSSSASCYSPSTANNINSIMATIDSSNSTNTFSSRTPSSSSYSSENGYASPVSPYKVYKSDKNKLLQELLAEIICNSSSYDEAAEFVSVIRVIRHEDCYVEAQRQDSELFEFFRDHFAFLIRMIMSDYRVIVDHSSPRLRSTMQKDKNNFNSTQSVIPDAHVSNGIDGGKCEIIEEALPFNDALQKEATSRAIRLLCGHTPRERMNMHQSSTPICGQVWDAAMTAEVFAEHRLEIEVMCEALYTACEELEGLVAQELDSAPVMGNNNNIVNSCQENNECEKKEGSIAHNVENQNIEFTGADSNQSTNKANILNAHPEHYSIQEREEKMEANTINTTIMQNELLTQLNSSTNDEFDDDDDDQQFVSAQSSIHDTTMSATTGESGKEKDCNEYEHFMCHSHHVQEEEEQLYKHHEREKQVKATTVQNSTRPVLGEIVKFIDNRCAIIQHILLVLESLLVCVANEHKITLSNNTITNNINKGSINNNNECKANSGNYPNVHSTSPSTFTPNSMSEFGILDFLSQSENLLSESRRKSMLTLQNVSSAPVPFSSASQLYSPSTSNNMCGVNKERNLHLREESTHTMKRKHDNITSPLLKPVSWVVQQQQQHHQKERSKKMQRQHQGSAHHHEEKNQKSHIAPEHDHHYKEEYQQGWHKNEEHIKENVTHTFLEGEQIEREKEHQGKQIDVIDLSAVRSLPLHIMTTTSTGDDRNEPNSDSDSKSGNDCNSCKSCGSLSLPHSSCSSSSTENDSNENRHVKKQAVMVGKELDDSGGNNGEFHDRDVDFNSIASSDTVDPLHFTVQHAINSFMHVFLSITTIHQQLTQYRMAYKQHCNASPYELHECNEHSTWKNDVHGQECQCDWCKRFHAIHTELSIRSEENLELLKRTTVALAAYDCYLAETSIAYIDGQGPAFTAQATMLLAHVLSPELLAANPTASRGGEALRWILSFVFGGCDSNDVARIQSERMQHQLLLTRKDSECCYSLLNSSDSDNETSSSSSSSSSSSCNSYSHNSSFEENQGDMTDHEHKREHSENMNDNNNDYNRLQTTKRRKDNEKSKKSKSNNNAIRDHDNTSPTIARLSVEYILAACFTCCHPLMTVIGCVAESDAYGCGITIARAVLQYAFTLAQTSARFLREPQLGNTWYTPFTSAMMRGLNELAHVHHSLEHSHSQQAQPHHNDTSCNQVNGKLHDNNSITDKTHTHDEISALRFTPSYSTGHYRFKPVPHAKVTGLTAADMLETARGRTTRRCLALQWAKCVVLSGRTLVRGGISEVYIPRDHYGYLNELSRRLQALLTNYVHVANAKKEQREIDLENELSSNNNNNSNNNVDSESEASLVSRRRLFSLLEITLVSAHAVPFSSSSPVQETELVYPTTSHSNNNTMINPPSSSVISISPKTTNLHKQHSPSAIPKKSISRLWSLANTESEDESKNRQRYDAAFIDSFCLGKSAADFLLETEYVVLPVHEIIFASLYSVLTATSEVMLCEQPRLNSIFVNELITLLYEVNQGMLKPWFLPSESTPSTTSSLLPLSPHSKSHSQSFTTCNKKEALRKIENDTQLEQHTVESSSTNTHMSNQVVKNKKKIRKSGRSHHAWMRIGNTHHTKNKRNVRSLHALIPEAQSNIDRVLHHPCVLLHAAEYGVLLREGLQCEEVLASWDARLKRNPDDLVRGFHTLLSELWDKLEDEYVCPSYRDYVVATRTLRMLLGVSVREQGMNLHGNVLHVDDLDVKGTKKEDVALRLGVMTSQDYTVGEMDEANAATKELSEVDSEAESDDAMSRSSQDSNTSNPKCNIIDNKMVKELNLERKTPPPPLKRTCECSDANLSSNEVNTLQDKDKHHVESLREDKESVREENNKTNNNNKKRKEYELNEYTSKCKKACQLVKTGALSPEPQFAKGQSALCVWGKPQVRRSRRYYNNSNNKCTSPTRTSVSALIHQHTITLVSTRSEIAILLARAPPTWNFPSASACLSWPTPTSTNTNTTLSEKNAKTERYNITVESATPTTITTDGTNKMNNKSKVNVVSVEVNKCSSAVSDHDIFCITTLLHPISRKTELTNSCNNIITNEAIQEENVLQITSLSREHELLSKEREQNSNIVVENMEEDEASRSVQGSLVNNKLDGESIISSFSSLPCDDYIDLVKVKIMSSTNSSIPLTSNSSSLPISSSNTTEEHEEEEEVNEVEEQELSSECHSLNSSSMVISPTSVDSVGYSPQSNTSSSIHTSNFEIAQGNAQLKVKKTSLRQGNSWSLHYPHTTRMLHSAAFALHTNDKSNNNNIRNNNNINSNHSFPSAFFSNIDMSRVFPEKKVLPKNNNNVSTTSSSVCTRTHDNKTERINTNKLLGLLSRQHDSKQQKNNNNCSEYISYSEYENHKNTDEEKESSVMEELHWIDKAPLQINTLSFDQVIKPHSMPCSPTWWERSLSFSNPELTTSYEQFAATTHSQVDVNSTSDNFLSKEADELEEFTEIEEKR